MGNGHLLAVTEGNDLAATLDGSIDDNRISVTLDDLFRDVFKEEPESSIEDDLLGADIGEEESIPVILFRGFVEERSGIVAKATSQFGVFEIILFGILVLEGNSIIGAKGLTHILSLDTCIVCSGLKDLDDESGVH